MSCAKFPDCTGALTAEGQEIKPDKPIGVYPPTGENVYLLNGRFGFYVQVGQLEKGKKLPKDAPKPRRASVPRSYDIAKLTLEDALKFLSLPRVLGAHPVTGKEVSANIGRFGPYIVHDGNFRSIKPPDDAYTIELPRALDLLAQEKKSRGLSRRKVKTTTSTEGISS
jgi:DNA topoisomerase-1